MCGLFGFSDYSNTSKKGLCELTNALAEQSASRGIDATGIAFCKSGNISIHKEPKSAYAIDFKHSEDISALIGHTRHSTQGDEKKNFNNHPFYGKVKGVHFALAHNGVLMNDTDLRKDLHLPKTKIETDSFIAVQLIEYKRNPNFIENIKYMAEQVRGSFSFSILDNKKQVYLVKGDSPLSVVHFPKQKIYVYASTEPILFKALIDTNLFDVLKRGDYEEIPIEEGEILKLCTNGNIERHRFNYSYYRTKGWWEYTPYSYDPPTEGNREEYINALKSAAAFQGISPDTIDSMLEDGFSPGEIEELIYEELAYEYAY